MSTTEAALRVIADGITTTFDEDLGCDVEVWLDADEMQEIARKALAEIAAAPSLAPSPASVETQTEGGRT